jgi:hypothetical protein
VLAACALAVMIVPLATTTPTSASQTPNSFHWARKPSQFTVQAVNNVDGEWKGILRNVISDWNKSDTVTIKEVSGSHQRSQDCDPTNGKIEVCNWKYGTQDGWLGLTRLFFDKSGDHVEAATVQMNDSYFEQNNGQYNDDDARRHTMCHEMGHAIGLDHVDTTSCLNHSQHAVFNYTKPVNRDYRDLERIYRHKDSSTTLAGKQKDGKDKKDKDKDKKDRKGKKNKNKRQDDKKNGKNRKDRKDRNDRKRDRAESESFFDPTSLPSVPSGLDEGDTVTVQNLDDGSKVVTFITWADEETS